LRILRHARHQFTQDLQNRLAGTQRIETLSTMAGGLAHDFNNLLTAILGNAEVAQLDPNLGDSARYCLTQIERASRHAAELTRQMMVFAGRAAPAALPVALDELVGEMAEILRASISQTSRLEFEMEPGLPLVLGEPSQLRQVVMNLLINASEAMSARGGVIRVTGRRAQRHGEQRVVLAVSDTGAGIAPELQRRIFDPFYSTKRQGRGLGLAAVRSIVESHGGDVSVESTPGQGATFRLSFPAHTGTPHTRVTRISSLVTGASGAILLVEDESSLRDAAVRLLSRAGFQVLPAANVDDAVALFRRHADELRAVVADLLLRNASGEELLRTLHSLRGDLPILIWTACDEEEVRARTAGVPVAMVLHKPRPLRDLAAAISRTLADSSGAVA
jgi:CheY-like chemotaxis protein